MITGIGLDIAELDRIETLDRKSAKFRERILTSAELALYETLSEKRKIEFLAGRFSAKEAFAKALGTGIGPECSFQDISVLPARTGAPVLKFKGDSAGILVSITHTRTVAAAQVILQNTAHIG
ncbi:MULTISPECIES: holo-ACP synthase [Sporosarcina]|uniref:holo-ACP synthase n=1 Tax=Sporosarcina TaxID=1569 RepID=UPI00058D2F8C|nr:MULTISPECIES: holo-ACP synthase [Sporosarcina]WJY27172.1 holo-ACP synthase [Sporosarcina sp. 0.2-SM1T-5]